MTKKELIRSVALETGCTIKDITRITEAMLAKVAAALAEEGEVSISDFGKFVVKETPARHVRNPHTGVMMDIEARKKPAFRPAAALKKAVQ